MIPEIVIPHKLTMELYGRYSLSTSEIVVLSRERKRLTTDTKAQ